MTTKEKALTEALRELVALFHAVNSHYLPRRNPYSFKALQDANAELTGDPYECGMNVTNACETLKENLGLESAGQR